jgi:hypothetical protein
LRDSKVDFSRSESVFDFLDEDAGTVGREAFLHDNGWVLQAIARGADDLDLYGVAMRAKLGGNVVGLPEREL